MRITFWVTDWTTKVWNITLTYQNPQKNRVPINFILGFIIRTYKKVGFGRLRYCR